MSYADDFVSALEGYLNARDLVARIPGAAPVLSAARARLTTVLGRAWASPTPAEMTAMAADDAKRCRTWFNSVRCARGPHDDDVHDFKSGGG